MRSPAPSRPVRRRASPRLRALVPSRAAVVGVARRAAPSLIALGAVAGIAACAWAGWNWMRTSPRFAIHEVRVVGNSRVTSDEIARLAGVEPGDNAFAASMRAIEVRVARSPWIASVRAQRRLPHAIEIFVEERHAAAIVAVGALYLVDAEGRPFKRAAIEAGEAEGLLVVTGLDRRLWQGGSDAGRVLVRRALAVARRWSDVPGRPAIGEVHLARTGVTLYTDVGAVAIHLGLSPDDELAARFARFDATWASLAPEERALARAVNLDSATRPDRVTVRLERAVATTM